MKVIGLPCPPAAIHPVSEALFALHMGLDCSQTPSACFGEETIH